MERSGAGKWSEFWYKAIGCRPASLCEAVGYDTDAGSLDYRGLFVGIRNGVSGAYGAMSGRTQLAGVACPDQTTCVAVGTHLGPTVAFTKGHFSYASLQCYKCVKPAKACVNPCA